MFLQGGVFFLVLSTVLAQSEFLDAILYKVETDELGDQQDGGDSPGELQYGGGGLGDQVQTPGDQQYRDDSESDQEDGAGQPEGDEETWTTSVSPLSVMEDHGVSESPVWLLFLAVPMVLLVVMSVLAVAYYMCVWRGGRLGYTVQRDLLFKT